MRKKIYTAIVATALMFVANTICVAQTREIKCDQSGKGTPENPFYKCDYYVENDETWFAPDIDCEVKPNFQGEAEKSTQYMNVYFSYYFNRNVEDKDSVVCRFTASANGTVDNVKMLHGTSPKYNNDVVGIIKATPNWSPGKKVVVAYFRNMATAAVGSVGPSPVEENNNNGEENILYASSIKVIPEFPGGDAEQWKWLGEHLEYPKKCVDEGIQGRVICGFVVEKDGSLSNIEIRRGVHPLLDEEAVRVIGKMPKWTPGRLRGKPVRVNYMLPITFRLSE